MNLLYSSNKLCRFCSCLLFIVVAHCGVCLAQQQITDYEELEGRIQVGPTEDIALNKTARGYTLLLPDYEKEIRGLVVVFEGRRMTLDTIPEDMILHPHAFRRGLGVLYVSTGIPADFYFEEESMLTVQNLIKEASEEHTISIDSLFYTGFSIGGTQALKFTIFCKKNPGKCDLLPDAVAVVDSPLDMTRFWYAMERAERLGFHPMSAGEGVWVSHWLEENLGGTPKEQPTAYIDYSPYTYTAENVEHLGGNAQYLKNIPIRTYAEPDVHWHIENRRRTYYSMNATDMAALVSDLKLIGNKEAQFISTHNKRDDIEGTTHSWSIVNNEKLMTWFVSHMEEK